MPTPLSNSAMEQVVTVPLVSSANLSYEVSIPIKEQWKEYWKQSPEVRMDLLQAIIKHVINKPYADNPHMHTKYENITIMHPNHDGGHAGRQYLYVDFLMDAMRDYGTEETRKSLNHLSAEERSITLLAAFMFRCGRTNEEASSSGLSQNERSAKIFSAIAEGLGYSEDLVNTLAYCIEHYAPVNDTAKQDLIPFEGLEGKNEAEKRQKAKVINGLLLLGHNTDLVRCWSNLDDIHSNNKDTLSAFFPGNQVDKLEELLIHFAKAACVWTGADFFYHKKVDGDKSMFTSPLVYQAQCVIDIATVLGRLSALKKDWYSAMNRLDFKTIDQLYKNACDLKLPEAYNAQVTEHYKPMAAKANALYKAITGIDPVSQSKASIEKKVALLKDQSLLSHDEIPSQNSETGLTPAEQRLYDWMIHSYPWTFQHSTMHMNAIMESGHILSSEELVKRGIDQSFTTRQEGSRDFVFLSLGNPESKGFRSQMATMDSFTIPRKDIVDDKGTLYGPFAFTVGVPISLRYKDDATEHYEFKGHAIRCEYKGSKDDNLHDTSFKTITVKPPQGEPRSFKLDFCDEVVVGQDIFKLHAYHILHLLRHFDTNCRNKILNGNPEELMQLVNCNIEFPQRELLTPQQLSVFDHRLKVNRSKEKTAKKINEILEFKHAVEVNSCKKVRKLLEKGFSTETLIEKDQTALAWVLQHPRYVYKTKLILLLVNAGASLTQKVQNRSVFEMAVTRDLPDLVEAMLSRKDQGDVVSINTETLAVATALILNETVMLDMFERHGLNYAMFDYTLLSILAPYPTLVMERILQRLEGKNSQFGFKKMTTRNQEAAAGLIQSWLQQGKTRSLQRLINNGILDVANQHPDFNQDLFNKLTSRGLHIPVEFKLHIEQRHKVHVYLVTADGNTLLVRSNKHHHPAPLWHGIEGEINGAITPSAVQALCLGTIGSRPVIDRIEQIQAGKDSDETVLKVQLKPGAIPQVFNTSYLMDAHYQSAREWAQDKERSQNRLSQAVLADSSHVPEALKQMAELDIAIQNNDWNLLTTLVQGGVYHPSENLLLKLIDQAHPKLDRIEYILKQGYSPNQTLKYLNDTINFLTLAALTEKRALFGRLIDLGADMYQEIPGTNGRNVVTFCIVMDKLWALEELKARGMNFNHPKLGNLRAMVQSSKTSSEIKAFMETVFPGTCKKTTTVEVKPETSKDVSTVLAISEKDVSTALATSENDVSTVLATPEVEHKIVKKASLEAFYAMTGLYGKPKTEIAQRVAAEYQITPFAVSETLRAFEDKIKALGLIPKEVRLVLADEGFHPVFGCFGFGEPTIAINREFLNHPDSKIEHLMAAISLEWAAIEEGKKSEKTFGTSLDFGQWKVLDEQLIKAKQFSIDTIKELLLIAGSFQNNAESKKSFIWPYELTGQFPFLYFNRYASERIKCLVQLAAFQNGVLSDTLQLYSSSELSFDALKTAAEAIPITNCYPDFPLTSSYEEKKAWFISHLPDLKEELIPHEWAFFTHYSIRLRQYVKLLFDNYGYSMFDDILKQAFDLEIPCYESLHSIFNGMRGLQAFDDSEDWTQHPVVKFGGYFKEIWQVALQFSSACSYEEAQASAERFLALYRHVHIVTKESGLDPVIDSINTACPPREMKIAFGSLLPRNFPKKTALDMKPWVEREYNEKNELGIIWKARWILGFWDGEGFMHLPSKIRALAMDEKMDEYLQTNSILADSVLPRIYPKNLLKSPYKKYEERWREQQIKYSAAEYTHLPENSSKKKIRLYIVEYPELIFENHETKQTVDPSCQLDFFKALDYQAKSPKGRDFVRSLFLNNGHLVGFGFGGSNLGCVRYMLNTQLLSFREKLMLIHSMKDDKAWDKLLRKVLIEDHAIYDVVRDLLPVLERLTFINKPDDHFSSKVFREVEYKIQPLAAFSEELYEILDYIQKSYPLNFINIGSYWTKKIDWSCFKNPHSGMDPVQLVRLYRMLDTFKAFYNWDHLQGFAIKIISELKSINSLDDFIMPFNYLLSADLNNGSVRIMDDSLADEVIEMMANHMIKHFGKDDGTAAYQNKFMFFINQHLKQINDSDVLKLLDKVTHGIEAQESLCKWIKNTMDRRVDDPRALLALIDTMNEISKDEKDKYFVMDFLSKSIQPEDMDKNVKHLNANPRLIKIISMTVGHKEIKISDDAIVFYLRMLHQQFWNLSIEQRAVVLDALIFPASCEMSDALKNECYDKNINYILAKLFPEQASNPREAFAASVIQSYLAVADKNQRQFLLSALMVAKKQSGQSSSIGSKLAVLCGQLGPAYIKLAQALHSHPEAPEDLRQDLASLKGDAAIPHRWDLVDLIKKTLPEKDYEKIDSIKTLLGSASYHIAVLVKLKSGEEQVLLLTRSGADKQAKQGFDHIQKTIDACPHPMMAEKKELISDLVREAKEMSKCELDHTIGDEQHSLAKLLYGGRCVDVHFKDSRHRIYFKPCESISSGEGYRLLTLAKGISFNKLKDPVLKQVVARAIVSFELRQILSGCVFDCDRHGEQAKIQQHADGRIEVGLFDFGEMQRDVFSDAQKKSMCDLLEALPMAIKRGESLISFIQARIKDTKDPSCKSYLIRSQKAMLALSDYVRVIAGEEKDSNKVFMEILKDILPSILPEYRDALKNGYVKQMSWLESLSFFVPRMGAPESQRVQIGTYMVQ